MDECKHPLEKRVVQPSLNHAHGIDLDRPEKRIELIICRQCGKVINGIKRIKYTV